MVDGEGLKHLVQRFRHECNTFSHTSRRIGLIFLSRTKVKNLLADWLECKCDFLKICNILPIFFLHLKPRTVNLRPIIFGPSRRLLGNHLSRHPCVDIVGTFSINIRVVGTRREGKVSAVSLVSRLSSLVCRRGRTCTVSVTETSAVSFLSKSKQ